MISLTNLGTVNKNCVTLNTKKGRITIYFSYKTAVSYSLHNIKKGMYEKLTRVNDWSNTTGKLLNECESDHSKRVDGEVFEKALAKAISSL